MYRTIFYAVLMVASFGLVLFGLDYYDFFDRQTMKTAQVSTEANSNVALTQSRGEEVIINRAADGHFWVNAYVNGDEVRFMVDTGASYVILSPDDAVTLGFDFWEEDYTLRVRTASGDHAMAPIMIDEIEIEDEIVIYDVRGAVLSRGSDVSLLGLSFLNKLSSYEFSGDELILTP